MIKNSMIISKDNRSNKYIRDKIIIEKNTRYLTPRDKYYINVKINLFIYKYKSCMNINYIDIFSFLNIFLKY